MLTLAQALGRIGAIGGRPVGDPATSVDEVLATACEAARELVGAAGARLTFIDHPAHGGAIHEAVSGSAGDAGARRVEIAISSGAGAGRLELIHVGPSARPEGEARADLEALAAHVGLAVGHAALARLARSTETMYRTLVEQIPAVTYYRPLDAPGAPSFVSPQVTALLGYTPADLVTDPTLWRQRMHPDDRARIAAEQSTFRPQDMPRAIRSAYRMLHRDGHVVWVENYALSVRDDSGRATFLMGVVFDVTERRRLEEQLHHAQKMEAIGKLAGGIAHDFNNLLSVILSYGAGLRAELAPQDPRRVDVGEIVSAGERARTLTRQLLALSQRQVLEPKIIDLGRIVRGLDQMLRRLIGEDVELVTEVRPVPFVKADPGQIEQVLMNLAVNARDAMPSGGRLTLAVDEILLEAEAAELVGVAPGAYVRVAVKDTGAGMDDATRARAFEPFFTTKDKTRNSGLGLSTALGVIQQSGGSMAIESTPGQGTTLAMVLPVTREAQRPTPPSIPALQRGGRETVLLVEDDEQVRRLVRTLLERLGYRVLEACDPDDALAVCARYADPIDLLLSDVIMPKRTGFELAVDLARLRPTTRVLFMSGYSEDAVKGRGMAPGTELLQKPFSASDLASRIRKVLDRS